MKLDQQQQDFVTLQSTLEPLSDSCFLDTSTVHTPKHRERERERERESERERGTERERERGEMLAMDHNNVSFFFASILTQSYLDESILIIFQHNFL